MATLTTEQRTLYTQQLSEAQAALHSLMIGGQARTFVDQNGERVEFTAANANRLRAYIQELKLTLGVTTVLGPMRVNMI